MTVLAILPLIVLTLGCAVAGWGAALWAGSIRSRCLRRASGALIVFAIVWALALGSQIEGAAFVAKLERGGFQLLEVPADG